MASQGQLWKAANDPRTGRTYYYNKQTRETTWTKPLELSSPEERREREEADRKKREFFKEMENNMRRNVANGQLSSDIFAGAKVPKGFGGGGNAREDKAASAEPKTFSIKEISGAGSESDIPTRIVRTISTIDDLVLEQAKRSESKDSGQLHSSPLVDLDFGKAEAKDAAAAEEDAEEFQTLQRRNSTSTIYMDSTMTMPDKDATIRCVCTVIRAHMLESIATGDQAEGVQAKFFYDYQSEGRKRTASEVDSVPSMSELVKFFRDVYINSQMETDCIIMALIYMERITKETGGAIRVRGHNWKSLVLSSLIMASKVWDDLSMWNSDFSQVCPSFTLKRINELELAMLDVLRYNVKVSAGDYAKYYFHLRSYCVRLGLTHDLRSLEPLNLAGAKKLQTLSEEYAIAAESRAEIKKRSVSMPEPSIMEADRASAPRGIAGTRQHPHQASLEQLVHMRIVEAGEQTPDRRRPNGAEDRPSLQAEGKEEGKEFK